MQAVIESLASFLSFAGQAEARQGDSASPQVLNLNQMLTERRRLYKQLCGESVSVNMHLEAELDPWFGNALEFEKLALNLLFLGRHSLTCGGQIEFETANLTLDQEIENASNRWIKLLVRMRRNAPSRSLARAASETWDAGLSRRLVASIVRSSEGWLTTCRQTEMLSTTEILLPSVWNTIQDKSLPLPCRFSRLKRSTAEPM